MNYISANEFLKQSEKVQKVLLEWWKPDLGDLFINKFDYNSKINCITMFVGDKFNGKMDKKDSIPLLQMHHLIKFIEHKGYKYMGMNNFHGIWVVKLLKTQSQFQLDAEIEDNDLLQALWKVSIQIAEDL